MLNIHRISAVEARPIAALGLMIFFFTVFTTMIQYATPILIQSQGFSASVIGLIIASASLGGAIFDFLISKIFKNIHFRWVFLLMFAICLGYPLLLRSAETVWFFLFVMVLWGLFFDLYLFGIFDFVGQYTKDHASHFGKLHILRTLGSVVASFIVSIVAIEYEPDRFFSLTWIFLAIAILFYVVLVFITKFFITHNPPIQQHCRPKRNNIFVELHLWEKLGKKMLPILLLTFTLFCVEGFFWTLAPLYGAEHEFPQFGGWMLIAYTIPALIGGWFITRLTHHFGKTRTAFAGLFVGSGILATFSLFSSPIMLLAIVALSSFFMSVALPAINAVYADYIAQASSVSGEIEGLEGFALNLGYIVGPLSAGILSDLLDIPVALSIIGLGGGLIGLFLLLKTPKHIEIT